MADYRLIPRLAVGLAGAMLLVQATPLAAEKTDVVVFVNGDRLTGEVKKLERGRLAFKTGATDTIQIAWQDVASVRASKSFDVETRTGERYFGSLAPAEEEGKLEVVGEQESWTLDRDSLVRLTPIEASFWKRLDGNFDLGFSFTEADDRSQLSLGAEVKYRTQKYLRSLSMNSVLASQSGVDVTNRSDLGLVVARFLRRPRRYFLGLARLEHNEELGIDLRTLLAAAAGFYVVQSDTKILGLAAGMAFTREEFGGPDPSQESIEVLLGFQFESFKFDTPERDVNINLTIFPSVSEFGRVRANLSARVRWEIVKDFNFGLTLLESYDSEPPTEATGKSDLTFVTSLGWSF
ncbi:MAG: DUF481 domain-containing protein [Thermoanaerobaculia bacterium]